MPSDDPAQDSTFGPVIFSYSRTDAIADGQLLDFSGLAREAGFKIPLAVTETVYAYLDPSPELADEGQSFTGRLWDVLNVLRYTISKAKARNTDTILFKVLFLMSAGADPVPIELQAICGPGDDGSPVLTILLPEED
jgi:hypothetical protein